MIKFRISPSLKQYYIIRLKYLLLLLFLNFKIDFKVTIIPKPKRNLINLSPKKNLIKFIEILLAKRYLKGI